VRLSCEATLGAGSERGLLHFDIYKIDSLCLNRSGEKPDATHLRFNSRPKPWSALSS